MTPAARVQSAIVILDLIISAARENGAAADTIIANWSKSNRFAGSKDRRAVRDHVYAAIRAFANPTPAPTCSMTKCHVEGRSVLFGTIVNTAFFRHELVHGLSSGGGLQEVCLDIIESTLCLG